MSEPVLIDPEAGFTRAFHRGCRGPMRNVTARAGMRSLEDETGAQLHLWECCGCGAMVLAGLDQNRVIVHRQLSRATPAPAPPQEPQP